MAGINAPNPVLACRVVFLRARYTSPLPTHRHGMPTVSVVVLQLSSVGMPSCTTCSHDCISDELHPIHTVILHRAIAPSTVMACRVVFLRARYPASRGMTPRPCHSVMACRLDDLAINTMLSVGVPSSSGSIFCHRVCTCVPYGICWRGVPRPCPLRHGMPRDFSAGEVPRFAGHDTSPLPFRHGMPIRRPCNQRIELCRHAIVCRCNVCCRVGTRIPAHPPYHVK